MRSSTHAEILERETVRARCLSGTWRASGTNSKTPGLFYSLILIEQDGKLQGTDTDARGFLKGRVETLADGQRIATGTFLREDGRKGTFKFAVTGKGNGLTGRWKDKEGDTGCWNATKQGDGVSADQIEWIKARRWWKSGDEPGRESLQGVDGATYSNLTLGPLKVKVPTGYEAKGPGGSSIKVDKHGVKAKPPSVEKLIEDVTGGGGSSLPAPPSTPFVPTDDPAARSNMILKIAAGAAAVAVLVAIIAAVRR